MSYIKSLFTLKKPPVVSNIKIGKEKYKIVNILLCLGFIIIFISFIVSLVSALFFNNLKVMVDEFSFIPLLLSIITLLLTLIINFVKINNAYTDILNGIPDKPIKEMLTSTGVILFSVYLAFFSVNEAHLIGLYNKGAYEDICKVYLTSAHKSNICINYEYEMGIDKSLRARILYFYDFKNETCKLNNKHDTYSKLCSFKS